MNRVAVGTYRVPAEETEAVVCDALQSGIRRIDTAALYKNEKEVGNAIRSSGILRANIHVTTKIHPRYAGRTKAQQSIERSLNNLGISFIDTVLIHRPDVWGKPAAAHPQLIKESWIVLEEYQKEGLIKNIGVSNFDVADVQRILTYATVKPYVNQICYNDGKKPTAELIELCASHGIKLEGYSPFGGAGAPMLKGRSAVDVIKQVLSTIDYVVFGGDLKHPSHLIIDNL